MKKTWGQKSYTTVPLKASDPDSQYCKGAYYIGGGGGRSLLSAAFFINSGG